MSDPLTHARAALHDLAVSTGAIDGALCSGSHRLHVTEGINDGFSTPKTGRLSRALGLEPGAREPAWLDAGAATALGLQAGTAVLCFRFSTDAGATAALLAYDEQPYLSDADLRYFAACFSGPEAGAKRSRDEFKLARAATKRRATRGVGPLAA